MGENLFE